MTAAGAEVTRRRGLRVLLLAAFAALAALHLPAAPASTASSPAAEKGVGAISTESILTVGVHESIRAGQHPVRGPSQLQLVSGHCVAAEAGGDAVTTAAPKALTAGERVPNQLSPIRSFVTNEDRTYYRVFSGDRNVGGFLTGAPPASADEAVTGLALPPENTADFLQEVLVPAGTRLQSSIAAPAFGQPGGLLQFELLDQIPIKNFGPGVAFR